MSVDFRQTGKNLLSLFLLFTFLMGFLPFGMTLRAEESGGEIEPAMKVQITADVKWVDVLAWPVSLHKQWFRQPFRHKAAP